MDHQAEVAEQLLQAQIIEPFIGEWADNVHL
jgi:hypothetical protein